MLVALDLLARSVLQIAVVSCVRECKWDSKGYVGSVWLYVVVSVVLPAVVPCSGSESARAARRRHLVPVGRVVRRVSRVAVRLDCLLVLLAVLVDVVGELVACVGFC